MKLSSASLAQPVHSNESETEIDLSWKSQITEKSVKSHIAV